MEDLSDEGTAVLHLPAVPYHHVVEDLCDEGTACACVPQDAAGGDVDHQSTLLPLHQVLHIEKVEICQG